MEPLAERLRPSTLDNYIGQKHLVGQGAVLRRMIESERISSFILWGPPGTGKTSRALRRMVEKFYAEPDTQILLLAYTNRAVDEICSTLDAIAPEVHYIRIGSELSCDERFRNRLVEKEIHARPLRKHYYEKRDDSDTLKLD